MPETIRLSMSLRNRLAISLISGAAILAILLFLGVRNFAAQIAQQSQDRVLGASVTSILDTAVIRNGMAEVDFPYASFSMLSTASDDRVFYAIYQDDRLISGYDTLAVEGGTTGTKSHYRTELLDDAVVRIATASRSLVGSELRTRITVSVAQTQDDFAETLNRISRNAAFLGIAFFLFAVSLSIWAASRTIVPLKRLATSVARRGPQDLTPVSSPVPSELAPLVSSLNKLMTRLEQSLKQSEDFIAEAAHRVRTPLATVRSYAEATLHRVDKEENRRALRSMVRAIDESSRAAGQLLDHAMITFRASNLEQHDLDLAELVRDLVLRLTPIAEMKDIELRLDLTDEVPAKGDPILLQNAIRNLIDNALKYSPSESVIEISVASKPTPSVSICDQGPGFAEDEIAVVSGRFERGRNAQGITGSGLGLTIASDVAMAHEGELKLANNPKGGACVTLSIS